MSAMTARIWFIIPELVLFAGVCVVAVMGLSHSRRMRDALPLVTCLFLAIAAIATPALYDAEHLAAAPSLMPLLGKYVKVVVCIVGMILAMVSTGLVDRRMEAAVDAGRLPFDPIRANRGEFFAFFLLSLIGVMLVCSANDLIWLFLALELTSLPTYVMVAMSRPTRKAQEAAVKYFFLGAMATAIFLYGFALLYGATGTIVLTDMRAAFMQQSVSGGVSQIGLIGMILAVLGICFKIAATPMHFYAADVYEGAASPVTAFLAFVPKTAGMIALILVLATIGGFAPVAAPGLASAVFEAPPEVTTTLWMISVLTMTLGNVGALWQKSVKRMLAYSSIAHTGYMLIGVIAAMNPAGGSNGINAVLFYLLAYGIMNTAAFAVLAALERRGEEIDTMDDLAGLRLRHPGMAAVLAIASGSLLGVPPLLGFWGKLYLFIAGIQAGQIALVVIAGLNSAISAWYYLRLVALPVLAKPSAQSETITPGPSAWPRVAGLITAVAVVVVPAFCQPLFKATAEATGTLAQAADEDRDVIRTTAQPQGNLPGR